MKSGRCNKCQAETIVYDNVTPDIILIPMQHIDSDICDKCWWNSQDN